MGRATCTLHLISAQASLKGIKYVKGKDYRKSYCPNIYTVPLNRSAEQKSELNNGNKVANVISGSPCGQSLLDFLQRLESKAFAAISKLTDLYRLQK